MRKRFKEVRPPGQLAAERGTIALRPWHVEAYEAQLRECVDFVRTRPLVADVCGFAPRGRVSVDTEAGRVVVTFERR